MAPVILQNYARHYLIGELLPEKYLQAMDAAKRFNAGFKTVEYLASAYIDQAWHALAPDAIPTDVEQFEHEVLHPIGMDSTLISPRYHSRFFSHCFEGYSACYYSYLWAEVLVADSSELLDTRSIDTVLGSHMLDTFLSKGDSLDTMEQFRQFQGRNPDETALLRRRGLA